MCVRNRRARRVPAVRPRWNWTAAFGLLQQRCSCSLRLRRLRTSSPLRRQRICVRTGWAARPTFPGGAGASHGCAGPAATSPGWSRLDELERRASPLRGRCRSASGPRMSYAEILRRAAKVGRPKSQQTVVSKRLAGGAGLRRAGRPIWHYPHGLAPTRGLTNAESRSSGTC